MPAVALVFGETSLSTTRASVAAAEITMAITIPRAGRAQISRSGSVLDTRAPRTVRCCRTTSDTADNVPADAAMDCFGGVVYGCIGALPRPEGTAVRAIPIGLIIKPLGVVRLGL